MSFQPNIKADIVQLQKEYEKSAKQKKAQENLNTKAINQANLVSAEQGFLEFTKEKGEAPKQADQKPTLRLNLDKLEKKEPALPASLKEKYNVRNTKKPRQATEQDIEAEQNKFNEKVKKLKNNMQEANIIKKIENKFDALQNSDDEDEEEFDEGQILSKTQSKAFKSNFISEKIYSPNLEFWEKNTTLQAGDPLQILNDKERGNKHRPQGQKKFFVNFLFYLFLKNH